MNLHVIYNIVLNFEAKSQFSKNLSKPSNLRFASFHLVDIVTKNFKSSFCIKKFLNFVKIANKANLNFDDFEVFFFTKL